VDGAHERDPELWVITSRIGGRCLLVGNAHTHPGHIHAWSEERGALVTIRKDDVIDASPLARAWIAGFLVGNEPSFADFLGVTWEEAETRYHVGDADYTAWRAALRDFRDNGCIRLPSSALHVAVRAVLDAVDPAGLLAMGVPADEYEPEVRDFVGLIEAGQTMSPGLVRSRFDRWFGDEWLIPEPAVVEIARQLALLTDGSGPGI
jgi:hypothetical protein